MISDYLKEMLPDSHGTGSKFKVRVLHVDHNETIEDNQIDHRMKGMSKNNNRNLRIAGWKLDGSNTGSAYLDIIIPVSVLGQFMTPQVGDVVWVEASRRAGVSEYSIVSHSTYDNEAPENGGTPVPLWGGQPGDYGYMHSYKHHNMQFSSKPKSHNVESVPNEGEVDFRSKWVASVTGYRFRRFYKSNAQTGKFVLRSDPVFDIDKQNINKDTVIADGVDYIKGQGIIPTRDSYPNPLNTPKKREEDPAMSYAYTQYRYLKTAPGTDPFKSDNKPVEAGKKTEFKLRNKNYNSFEPLLDKSYRAKTKGFERELQAVDEWQTALKGNNKILMQDVHGDGEQLLMLFKNALDAGLTIIQNKEVGQTRLRDQLGQTLFFEGDPENPRVVLVTANRQRLEMGHIKGKGNYVFIRNGGIWGDSDTSWGTKTGKEQSSVFNQEIIFVDSEAVAKDADFKKLLSPGAAGIVKGAGMFYRSSDDAENKFEQTYVLYRSGGDLKEKSEQKWIDTDTSINTYNEVNGSGGEVKYGITSKLKGKPLHEIKTDNSTMILEKYIQGSGLRMGSVELTSSGIDVNTEKKFTINVGNTSGTVNIGNPLSQVTLEASALVLMAHSIDLIKV